jgi:hypothetical protein
VKSYRVALSIALVMIAIWDVIAIIDGQPEDAIVPGLPVVALGVLVYQQWRQPLPPPKAWSSRRITIATLVLVPMSAVVVGSFAWVALKAAWPNRAIGLAGFVVVVAMLVWLIQTARREDQLARQAAGQGTSTD